MVSDRSQSPKRHGYKSVLHMVMITSAHSLKTDRSAHAYIISSLSPHMYHHHHSLIHNPQLPIPIWSHTLQYPLHMLMLPIRPSSTQMLSQMPHHPCPLPCPRNLTQSPALDLLSPRPKDCLIRRECLGRSMKAPIDGAVHRASESFADAL